MGWFICFLSLIIAYKDEWMVKNHQVPVKFSSVKGEGHNENTEINNFKEKDDAISISQAPKLSILSRWDARPGRCDTAEVLKPVTLDLKQRNEQLE